MLQFNESDNKRDTTLSVGKEFEIHLPENPTTGFRWKLTSNSGGMYVLLDDDFELTSTLPGSGGSHYWRFRATGVGLADVNFVYQRSSEQVETATRRFTLHVRVH